VIYPHNPHSPCRFLRAAPNNSMQRGVLDPIKLTLEPNAAEGGFDGQGKGSKEGSSLHC